MRSACSYRALMASYAVFTLSYCCRVTASSSNSFLYRCNSRSALARCTQTSSMPASLTVRLFCVVAIPAWVTCCPANAFAKSASACASRNLNSASSITSNVSPLCIGLYSSKYIFLIKPCTRVLMGVICCFTCALSVYSTLPKWRKRVQTYPMPITSNAMTIVL